MTERIFVENDIKFDKAPSELNTSNQYSNEIDLASLIFIMGNAMRARRFLTFILFFGSIGVAAAYAFLLTPVYKAELLLSIIDERGRSVGGNKFGDLGLTAGVGGVNTEQGTKIAMLTSRIVVNSFIENNNLIPIFFKKQWDDENKKWKSDKTPTISDGYYFFKGICNIIEDKKSGIITLTIEWTDPKIAADWANALVQHADSYLKNEAITNSKRGIDFLQAELLKTSTVEIQQSILQLMENELKKSMIANTSTLYTYKIIDPATVPERKDRPKRLLSLILGGLIGTIMSIFIPLLLLISDRIRAKIRLYRQNLLIN